MNDSSVAIVGIVGLVAMVVVAIVFGRPFKFSQNKNSTDITVGGDLDIKSTNAEKK